MMNTIVDGNDTTTEHFSTTTEAPVGVGLVNGDGLHQQGEVIENEEKPKITYLLPNQCMEEGHFYIILGEDVDVSTGRYKMLSLLGEGAFAKVVGAWDRKHRIPCAVKVVRNIAKYTRDAEVEIKYLERVKAADPEDKYFREDYSLLPERPRPHVHRHEEPRPVSARLPCEDHLHTEMKLMHTDLKPENIILEEEGFIFDPRLGNVPKSNKIRICDLGGVYDSHKSSGIVSTRHYRSPEVILGLGWMFPTDMWSMGCLIYELATGKLLYDTHENLEHLNMMEKTLGRLPTEWSRQCSDEHRDKFDEGGRLRSVEDPESLNRVYGLINVLGDNIKDVELLDVILGLLNYDKTKRMTARQLAIHPYVLKHFPQAVQQPTWPGLGVCHRTPRYNLRLTTRLGPFAKKSVVLGASTPPPAAADGCGVLPAGFGVAPLGFGGVPKKKCTGAVKKTTCNKTAANASSELEYDDRGFVKAPQKKCSAAKNFGVHTPLLSAARHFLRVSINPASGSIRMEETIPHGKDVLTGTVSVLHGESPNASQSPQVDGCGSSAKSLEQCLSTTEEVSECSGTWPLSIQWTANSGYKMDPIITGAKSDEWELPGFSEEMRATYNTQDRKLSLERRKGQPPDVLSMFPWRKSSGWQEVEARARPAAEERGTSTSVCWRTD